MRANFKLFHLYFCYFCSRKYRFLCYFLSTAPLEKLISKKKTFRSSPRPPPTNSWTRHWHTNLYNKNILNRRQNPKYSTMKQNFLALHIIFSHFFSFFSINRSLFFLNMILAPPPPFGWRTG